MFEQLSNFLVNFLISRTTRLLTTCMPSVEKACHCAAEKPSRTSSSLYSFLMGVGLVVLPKCPFCIIAYSGALGVCGSSAIGTSVPTWGLLLVGAFLLMVFVSFQLNFKGWKTFIASILLAIGGATMLSFLLFQLPVLTYYISTVVILFAVWLNGSFLHFFHKSIIRFKLLS